MNKIKFHHPLNSNQNYKPSTEFISLLHLMVQERERNSEACRDALVRLRFCGGRQAGCYLNMRAD